MALYEYVCTACSSRFDKRMPMSDVLQSLPCPKCGNKELKSIGDGRKSTVWDFEPARFVESLHCGDATICWTRDPMRWPSPAHGSGWPPTPHRPPGETPTPQS